MRRRREFDLPILAYFIVRQPCSRCASLEWRDQAVVATQRTPRPFVILQTHRRCAERHCLRRATGDLHRAGAMLKSSSCRRCLLLLLLLLLLRSVMPCPLRHAHY